MLYDNSQICQMPSMPSMPDDYQERWKRNEKKDLKRAMDLFFRMKENIEKLHPNCKNVIHSLIQTRGL